MVFVVFWVSLEEIISPLEHKSDRTLLLMSFCARSGDKDIRRSRMGVQKTSTSCPFCPSKPKPPHLRSGHTTSLPVGVPKLFV
jgi:hypothetical protein